MRTRRWWTSALVCVLSGVALLTGACSGGGGGSSSSRPAGVSAAARQQGALAAGRTCRMWTELWRQAITVSPLTPAAAGPFDVKSGSVATAANAASAADPTWNALATDVAGANDFASAALPDINSRIVVDCKAVPADVVKTIGSEPDPFATTTTTP